MALTVSDVERFRPAPHWKLFPEYIRYEQAVGAPDAQLDYVQRLSVDESWEERMWRIGCYGAYHAFPAAYATWLHWPYPRINEEGERFRGWLELHKGNFPSRAQRRAVRALKPLDRYFRTFGAWIPEVAKQDYMSNGDYWAAWSHLNAGVYGVGRYISLKILELMKRMADFPGDLQGIVPRGGDSPREALSLLYPDEAVRLIGPESNSPENLAFADSMAGVAQEDLAGHGVEVSHFVLQTCLCGYKSGFLGGKHYPGVTHDNELEWFRQIADHWQFDGSFYEFRAANYPAETLGEMQGWAAVRPEIQPIMQRFGYLWSDLKFDYMATTDFAHPVARERIAA